MRTSLRALAALIAYPTAELLDALPEVRRALSQDAALDGALPALDALVRHLLDAELLDLQEEYVGLFDRTRSLCLNLFEHVHGDSRERGPAMVELIGIYAAAGLAPATGELPDHLPLLLEHAAVTGDTGLLANAAPVIDLLHGRLLAREAAWAGALEATLRAAGATPGSVPAQPEVAQTAEALDAEWAEAPVIFGQGADPAAECGPDILAAKLRAARRAPNPAPRRPVIRRVAAIQG
ncbi:nitrate reductase molybdenum cofactor assembly chaperone [Roseomonas frigidaquae]|uniref:Nitrate reductase molybdenum cofactor assembly chaperone n=1 Tax=Falsiroseomonas frigidaquae TaxID=487318 RepID=A0ABX1EW49_9PROT|nr:nitrate reductase molybdenum cofactor assembly chaperone [Falsiroseomonas frigidaquae]NKE43805.1 nitrate reductase molybdenum cofactor assembly chaperone [Falsiroseomonas frigidaquae]